MAEHEMDMHKMMMDMDKKLDLMMEHLGCKKMSEDEYMSKSDEEKDKIDKDEIENKAEKIEE